MHLTLTRREADVVLHALEFLDSEMCMRMRDKALKQKIEEHYTTPILGTLDSNPKI